MRQLRPPSLLEQLGLSGAQRAAVLGSLVGRMAAPASERTSWHWLRHRDTIETRLLQRAPTCRPAAPSPCTTGPARAGGRVGPTAAGPPRPFQGEAPRLSAAHAGPGAGRQRLRAPLQGPGRQRRRGRRAAGHAGGPGRAARGGRRQGSRHRGTSLAPSGATSAWWPSAPPGGQRV